MKLSSTLFALATLPLIPATPTPPYHPKPKPPHSPKKPPGLDILAKRAGLQYFGTAIDNVVLNNTRYTSIAHNVSEFGQVTPSNGQKWMHIEPQRGVFNYTFGDQVIVPGKKAGQVARCHTFVWHNQLPEWLEQGNWTKLELIEILENHIKHEARHYYHDCIAWDVVNEAFEDDGSWRKTIWLDVIGEEYVELAFKFARKYTKPGTKLHYNDYGIERVNNKSLAVAELASSFLSRNIPIDGIGLQSHFTIGRAPTYSDLTSAITLFDDLGLETVLTELDVRVDLPDSEEKRRLQASVYGETVRACVDRKGRCVGVTVWDFWDPVSWVPESFPGYGNACLWDEGFDRKPAYWAIREVLRSSAVKGER